MRTLVLLDTHALIHRAYHALPKFKSRNTGEPTGALYGLSSMLLRVVRELKPGYIVAAYDRAEPTFRHTAYDGYKAKRPEAEDDLVKQLIRSHDIVKAFGIPIIDAPGFEADDVLGGIVEQTKNIKDLKIIIVSGDMDVLQLVDDDKVVVYTMRKRIEDTVIYDEKKVEERFGFGPTLITDFKGLKGDPSDNIVGVRGIGEKTATDIIKNFGTLENLYKKLETSSAEGPPAGGLKERVIQLLRDHKEDAFFSKTLATIRRDVPIKFELPKENYEIRKENLKKIFAELGFTSLVQRLENGNGSADGKTKIIEKEKTQKVSKKKEFNDVSKNESLFWKDIKKDKNLYIIPSEEKFAILGENKIWNFDRDFFSAETKKWEKIFDEKYIVGFKLKELFKFLKKYGIKIPEKFFDCGTAMWALDSTLNVQEIPEISALPEIYDDLLKNIKQKELEKVIYDIEFPLIQILAEMELSGIGVDRKFLDEFKKEIIKKIGELESEIHKLAGESFNISSPAQVGQLLFGKLNLGGSKKTKTGKFSTKESELLKLKDKSSIAALILDYRELTKLLTTYVDPLRELAMRPDGKIHTTFNQTGTVTGRLSSDSPNLQNIPIRSEFGARVRGAFVASPGFTFAAFDYAQIELKILAALSGDEKMMDAFRSGADIHRFTAANIYNTPFEEVTKKMRDHAKTINFGIVFGMGVRRLAQSTGMNLAEAQKFYDEYFNDFPGVHAYIEKIKKEAKTKGYAETLFGRKRFFDIERIKGDRFLESEMERMALNAVIQGTDADIVKRAMILVRQNIDSQKARLILQIHDELLYEIKDDIIKMMISKIRKIMENACTFPIPLLVDIKIGKRWDSLIKYVK